MFIGSIGGAEKLLLPKVKSASGRIGIFGFVDWQILIESETDSLRGHPGVWQACFYL